MSSEGSAGSLTASAQKHLTLERGESHTELKSRDRNVFRQIGGWIKGNMLEKLRDMADKLQIALKPILRKIKDFVAKRLLRAFHMAPGGLAEDLITTIIETAAEAAVDGLFEGLKVGFDML